MKILYANALSIAFLIAAGWLAYLGWVGCTITCIVMAALCSHTVGEAKE